MMSKISILFLCLFTQSAVIANDGIVGIWEIVSGKARVEIYKVQNKYYGRVIGLKNPKDEKGAPKVDKKNPDKILQDKPIIGLVVLRDLVYNEEANEWYNGKLYNPDDGRVYKCLIKLKDNQTMDVRGYIGFTLLGKTQTLYKVK